MKGMNMSKHTPGPWVVKDHHQGFKIVCESKPYSLAETIHVKANANLFAASPDLLEACERARVALDILHEDLGSKYKSQTSLMLQRAVLKARGEEC